MCLPQKDPFKLFGDSFKQSKCSKLTETLTSSHIPGLNKENVFPETGAAKGKMMPPPANTKVSLAESAGIVAVLAAAGAGSRVPGFP